MNNPEIIVAVTCVLLFIFDLIAESFVFNKFSKLSNRVDDLEKQIAHISITSAEFFCATNNRIADISTVVDTLDGNVDDLFDENFNRCQSITSLKNDIDSITNCINCKKSSPFKRFRKW